MLGAPWEELAIMKARHALSLLGLAPSMTIADRRAAANLYSVTDLGTLSKLSLSFLR